MVGTVVGLMLFGAFVGLTVFGAFVGLTVFGALVGFTGNMVGICGPGVVVLTGTVVGHQWG